MHSPVKPWSSQFILQGLAIFIYLYLNPANRVLNTLFELKPLGMQNKSEIVFIPVKRLKYNGLNKHTKTTLIYHAAQISKPVN